MDSKCPQIERPVKTDDLSKPKEKNKSTNTLSANWSGDQMSNKMSDRSPGKKDSGSHQSSRQSFYWQRSAKDLSHIICFNCKQKDHYSTECLKPSEDFNVFDDLSCNEPSCNDTSCNDLSSQLDAPNSAV